MNIINAADKTDKYIEYTYKNKYKTEHKNVLRMYMRKELQINTYE